MINMLKALMNKVDSMQKQMDSVRREVEMLRKNQKEMLEFQNTVLVMKDAFTAYQQIIHGISEVQDNSTESSEIENQRKQRLEKQNIRISKNCGTTKNSITYV